MGFRGAFTVLRLGRIPIRVHWSLLLILPYLALVIGQQFARAAQLAGVPVGHLALGPYAWGFALSIALFVCVLLHELSHVAVGLRVGAEVHDVTLMMLGGVTNMTKLPPRARFEGLMALAGPLASALLAALFFGAYRAIPLGQHDLRFGFFYLGQINLVLAVFNLIPAFPMDGGRLLRSIFQLWADRASATKAAALVGRVIAVGLGALGLYTGNFILMLIAVFIFFGAAGEARQTEIDGLIRRYTVRQVMDRHPAMVDPAAPLSELSELARATGASAFFVVGPDGELLGTVSAATVMGVAEPLRPLTRALDVMIAGGPTVAPTDAHE
ncbi:MAG: site-2 protease family protein, partial [Deltaproteobacteria bacterium]